MEKLLQLLTLLGVICFFLVFTILGLVLTYNSTILLYESMASLSWPTTEGIITHSEIERHRSRGRKANTYFEATVRYDYTVEGVKYTGDRYRIGYGGTGRGQGWAREIVDAHPVGTVVKVYSSPRSPAESVLVSGAHWLVYFTLVVGIAMFLVCAYFVFACLRSAVSVWVND